MPQAIDVTGLSPEAIRVVESLVALLRENATNTSSPSRRTADVLGKSPNLQNGGDAEKTKDEERNRWGIC